MRNLTPEQIALKNERAGRTFWLVDVSLRADGSYPAAEFYFCSQGVAARGVFYEPGLQEKPRISQSLGVAPDGGTIRFDNTTLEFGHAVLPKERNLDGSAIVVWYGWASSLGGILVDKFFEGEITEVNASSDSRSITLRTNSDLLRKTARIGSFPMAQRCVVGFNRNGLLSPDESDCGWQTAQGGNPLFCDKTEDGANGCREHNNLHRIRAIPFFANAKVTGGVTDNGGYGNENTGGSGGYGGWRKNDPRDFEIMT